MARWAWHSAYIFAPLLEQYNFTHRLLHLMEIDLWFSFKYIMSCYYPCVYFYHFQDLDNSLWHGNTWKTCQGFWSPQGLPARKCYWRYLEVGYYTFLFRIILYKFPLTINPELVNGWALLNESSQFIGYNNRSRTRPYLNIFVHVSWPCLYENLRCYMSQKRVF